MTMSSLFFCHLPPSEQEMEKKGELEDGDPLNGFFKKIFAQVSSYAA